MKKKEQISSFTQARWMKEYPAIEKGLPTFLFNRSRSNNQLLSSRGSCTWIKIPLVSAELDEFRSI